MIEMGVILLVQRMICELNWSTAYAFFKVSAQKKKYYKKLCTPLQSRLYPCITFNNQVCACSNRMVNFT